MVTATRSARPALGALAVSLGLYGVTYGVYALWAAHLLLPILLFGSFAGFVTCLAAMERAATRGYGDLQFWAWSAVPCGLIALVCVVLV